MPSPNHLREWVNPNNAALAGIGAAGALAGWVAAFAMRWGPAAYSDSVSYLEMAHNLLAGLGPIQIKGSGTIKLLIGHPPFYSMLLALLSLTGQPLISAARTLNIILFALFVSGTGALLYAILRRPVLALWVSFVLLASREMVIQFVGAMSEPVFYCLGFFSVFGVLVHLRTKKAGILWVSAGLAGLSMISRFTGAVPIGAGCAVLLLFSAKPMKKRLLDALSYFGAALIPFGIYRVYLAATGQSLGVSAIPTLPAAAALTADFFTTLASVGIHWLPWGGQIAAWAPNLQGAILTGLGFSGTALLGLRLFRHGLGPARAAWEKPAFQVGLTFAVFNLGYLAFVLLTYLLVSVPKPVIDDRVLSPLYPGGLLCAAGFLDFILEDARPAGLRSIVPAGVFLLFIAANLGPTTATLQALHIAGSGYTSKNWQRSSTLKAVIGLPSGLHLISDNIDVIKLYTFRSASRIPELESLTPQPLGQKFGDAPDDPVEAQFRSGQAALVLFNQEDAQFTALYGEQGAKARIQGLTTGLTVLYQGPDGAIYMAAPKK